MGFRCVLCSLGKFLQKRFKQLILRPFSGFHRILEFPVATQVMAFPLEEDHCFPLVGIRNPLHTGYTTGVIAANSFGAYQFDTSAIHKCHLWLAAADCSLPASQMGGHHHSFFPAVALAPPRGHGADIFRWGQGGQSAKTLARQVHSLAVVASGDRRADFVNIPQLAGEKFREAIQR